MPTIKNAIPDLAAELSALIGESDQPELAPQVADLEIVDRCRCDDDFCAMFYTVERPSGGWGDGHWNLSLDPGVGMIILDVLSDRIVAVEVLDRPEIRGIVLRLLP